MTKENLRSPDWLGIGTMKSASSWVYKQLKAHPQNGTPRLRGRQVKEMHFIDRLNITLNQYLIKFGRLNTHKVGEYTPNYFATPYAPAFIKTYFPEAKLFTIFRNPADRAFSHYKDHLYYKHIPPEVSFMQAFNEDYPKKESPCFSIKSKGMYGDQLELWYKYFNKEQLKVLFYEDLLHNPAHFIQTIYEHCGLEKNYLPPNYKERVVKRYNKAFDDMVFEEKDRTEVVQFYREQVKKLSDLTGRKLEWR
jgi:hypothetical protein